MRSFSAAMMSGSTKLRLATLKIFLELSTRMPASFDWLIRFISFSFSGCERTFEVKGGIFQIAPQGPFAQADKASDHGHVLRRVHRGTADDFAIAQTNDAELSARRVASDDLVNAMQRSSHLQIHVVLIGPE